MVYRGSVLIVVEYMYSVLHTEMWLGGGQTEFPKCRGGQRCMYTMY